MHGKKFAPYVFFPISTAEIIVMSAFSISHTKVDNDTHFQILNEIIIHDISHKRNKHMGMRTIRFTNKTMINFFFLRRCVVLSTKSTCNQRYPF